MRRTLIGTLVIVLVMMGAFPRQYASAQDDLWAAVRNLPAGSRVRVTLREDGTNVTGTLVELREDAVVMTENAADRAHAFRFPSGTSLRDAVPFARADVARATLVEIALPYRSFPPNAAVARRVVSEFRGRKTRLEVRFGTNKAVGTIDETGADDFAVNLGRDDLVRVPYAEVTSVQRGATVGKGRWIALAAIGAGLGSVITLCAMGWCDQ